MEMGSVLDADDLMHSAAYSLYTELVHLQTVFLWSLWKIIQYFLLFNVRSLPFYYDSIWITAQISS